MELERLEVRSQKLRQEEEDICRLNEEPAVDLVPPDETRRTAMDPDAMTRTPTNCYKIQQSTAGQEEGGSDCNLELPKVRASLALAMTRGMSLATT